MNVESTRAYLAEDSRAEPGTGILLAVLLAVCLLPRLLVFPVNENLHGDAVARTELALRWLEEPRWISSFHDGAYQFGPLHLYTVAAALWAGVDKEDAGRWVSLLFGVLTVVPLFFMTRRMFGWKAGLAAGLAFAAWGMHVQMSTTASSEALSLFLIITALAAFARGWEEGRVTPLFWSAMAVNLACATRYDAWMLIPILSLLLLFGDKDRVAALTRAVLFGFFCLPFPMFWMQGNEVAAGSALYPVTFIEEFHRAWAASGADTYGEVVFRLQNLFFWPAVALFTLTPLVAVFGAVGMVHVWRKFPEHRWLVWVALVPTAYFTVRGAVLMNFVPLGRFTVNQIILLLPFVATGFVAVASRLAQPMRHGLIGVTALLAVAVPVWLALFTWQAEGGMAVTLNPVSPVAQNPPRVMAVARWLKAEVAPHKDMVVVLDSDPRYVDLQLGFFSGVPEDRLIRVRWGQLVERIRKARPEYVVRIEGGDLEKHAEFDARENRIQLADDWYEVLPGFDPPLHVYRRVKSRSAPLAPPMADMPRGPAPEVPRLTPTPTPTGAVALPPRTN